ncbi:Nn.00g075450.m01.CDS01 [Neocucurbitaria sp. VM-36]
MGRKGTAKVRKPSRDEKYIFVDSNDEEIDSFTSASEKSKAVDQSSPTKEQELDLENVDPEAAREQLNPSNSPKPTPKLSKPRQAPATADQRTTLANSLFPFNADEIHPATKGPEPPTSTVANKLQDTSKHQRPLKQLHSRIQSSAKPRSQPASAGRGRNAGADANAARRTQEIDLIPTNRGNSRQNLPNNNFSATGLIPQANGNMALAGGAAIPPNQQRNMRACMVCSIVRTQQQFMTHGCPNCEDILELIGNSEQVNDCTSQVFDGLISIADTKRSWVARYQRLEGYVPGVYATQVEGILPEDVIVAVENAGINYVPRDGSEQDMLPKD